MGLPFACASRAVAFCTAFNVHGPPFGLVSPFSASSAAIMLDQLHACGGNARCTTCRVEFLSGEPEVMTAAEKATLAARGLTGVRLSCQILCDHDMTVRAISRLAGSGRKDAGPRPAPDIQPQPVTWVSK